jgi:hypothetical protein
MARKGAATARGSLVQLADPNAESRKLQGRMERGRSHSLKHSAGTARDAVRMCPMTFWEAAGHVLSGGYVIDNWLSNENPEDLADDVVQMNNNLALVAALFLSFSFPIFFSPDAYNDDPENWLAVAIMVTMAFSTVCFFTMVVVAIRTISITQLVDAHAMKTFVIISHNYILLPARLLVPGVVGLLGASFFWARGATRTPPSRRRRPPLHAPEHPPSAAHCRCGRSSG